MITSSTSNRPAASLTQEGLGQFSAAAREEFKDPMRQYLDSIQHTLLDRDSELRAAKRIEVARMNFVRIAMAVPSIRQVLLEVFDHVNAQILPFLRIFRPKLGVPDAKEVLLAHLKFSPPTIQGLILRSMGEFDSKIRSRTEGKISKLMMELMPKESVVTCIYKEYLRLCLSNPAVRLGIQAQGVDTVSLDKELCYKRDIATYYPKSAHELVPHMYLLERPRGALKCLKELMPAYNELVASKNDLAEHNLALVVRIAKRLFFRLCGESPHVRADNVLSLHDFIQEGNIGLHRAIDKFDFSLGYKFSTYATYEIRCQIQQLYADQSRVVRIPDYLHDTLAAYSDRASIFIVRYGREASIDEMARFMGLPREEIVTLRRISLVSLSLDSEIHKTEINGATSYPDPKTPLPEDSLISEERCQAIEEQLRTLNKRDAEVLRLRFGLGGRGKYTLDQVGEIYGINRNRVRQLQLRGLANLREEPRSGALRGCQ